MKITITETVDYRVELFKVETFEKGKSYTVKDPIAKSLIGAGKAVEFKEKERTLLAEETKVVTPEETKTPKKRGPKPKVKETE